MSGLQRSPADRSLTVSETVTVASLQPQQDPDRLDVCGMECTNASLN